MTVTIPTSDLVGIIGDALHFVSPDKDDTERRCVHLRWHGGQFHASATDGIRAVVSSWSPEDRPDQDVQGELGVELGSEDDDWEFLLSVDDAVHLIATAKPIKHLEHLPLFVEADGEQLTVRRAKQSRVPGFTLGYDGLVSAFPDLREHIVEAVGRAEPVKEIWFNAALMADFGKVRQRGCAAKWTFGGTEHPTVVEIGERFVGIISPVRAGNDSPDETQPA